MSRFRKLIAVGLLLCLAPLASMALAALIAKTRGCTLHEGFANPCVIAGVDVGSVLYSMAVMGWLVLLTLPLAALLVAAWGVVEIVHRFRRPGPNT